MQDGAADVVSKLEFVTRGVAYTRRVAAYERRLLALEEQGLNPKRFHFSASFGREIEYYTGFVFQIEVNGVNVAGGGRYDDMLGDLGAPSPIPAFGFAIHTERLQAVLA